MATDSEHRPTRHMEAAGKGARILAVDDIPDVVESMSRLLRMRGFEVMTARDGLDALEIASSWCPDVVLLDIGLPGMDGYEVARRLRESPSIGSICIIAITGYWDDEARRRTREIGFDAHLAKPVELDALLSALSRCDSVPRPESHVADGSSSACPPGVLIEDVGN